MDEDLIFLIIDQEMVMRRIMVDFIRQMIRDDEIPAMAKSYDFPSGEEALRVFEILFKNPTDTQGMYKGEQIIPMPGLQRNAIAVCDMEMGPREGIELLRVCYADEVFREISFIMMIHEPDIGVISELGELGVSHVIVKPLTFDKFSQTVLQMNRRIQSGEQYYNAEVERFLSRGEYKEALKLIDEVESKYSNLRWTILRGRAYLGMNEAQKAESNFTQAAMGAHIASVIALKHLVETYETMGNADRTISSLNELTQKSPNNKDRRLKLAGLYTEHNRLNEAKEVLDALAKDKHIPTELKMKIADLFAKAGFTAEAADLEVQMVEGNLDDYIFCNDRAISLRKQGKYDLAEESYLKILEAHPKEAVIWFNRGVNLGSWGKKDGSMRLLREAEESFRKALRLDPDLKEASNAIMSLKESMRSQRNV